MGRNYGPMKKYESSRAATLWPVLRCARRVQLLCSRSVDIPWRAQHIIIKMTLPTTSTPAATTELVRCPVLALSVVCA
eukprot:7390267-Prymnesium_polylepis.4